MINIDELKAKHAREIEDAIKQNELNARLEMGEELRYMGDSITQKGKKRACAHELTYPQLKELLNEFPQTEDIRVYVGHNTYEPLPYHISSRQEVNKSKQELNIEWICEELHIAARTHIDTRCPDIMQFFSKGTRRLSNIEVDTYFKAVTRWNKERIENYPCLRFCCGRVVRFQGGTEYQVAPGIITAMVETIKWMEMAEE